MERVFDICHGCRRCFNLCDSFPRLFDLIDDGPTGELDGVTKADYAKVEEACTLCDMCFMTKCPYVPPHPFDVDFPHLMLRHRAVQARKARHRLRRASSSPRPTATASSAAFVAGLANWATDAQEHADAPAAGGGRRHRTTARACRAMHGETFEMRTAREGAAGSNRGGARLRQAQGRALRHLLRRLQQPRHRRGRRARCWPSKASRPRWSIRPAAACRSSRPGDLEGVAAAARQVSAALLPLVDKGYDVVALTPSCGLMLKFEWPLILPEDPAVERLSQATLDISEYVVDIAKKDGLAPGLQPIEGGVTRAPRLPRAGPEHGRQVGRDAAADPRDARRADRALLAAMAAPSG